jgi:DNA polymerase III subunit gamma/tau
MTHQVIPRKYRPQTFKQLVGQETVKRGFQAMLQRQKVPHALLLCGTRGIGKTSTARIFAKALLCPQLEPDGNPCAQCPACKQVESGHHMDVLEIDGASNNGVEAIRELRETAYYLPSQGKHKVYIIDEVHMLSNSAFNALLKILEEPPAHLVFVFATTDPGQLPQTILSRVMRFDFKPIPTSELAKHLELIAQNEQRNISPEALNKIAMMGDGSMRDAEMLLEQVFTYYDAKEAIELKHLETIFALVNQESLVQLVSAIGQEDVRSALEILGHLVRQGFDPYTIGLELHRLLRYVLLAAQAPEMLRHELAHVPDLFQQAKTWTLAPALKPEPVLAMFQCLLKTLQIMRHVEHPHWVLEACLVQLCRTSGWFTPRPDRDKDLPSVPKHLGPSGNRPLSLSKLATPPQPAVPSHASDSTEAPSHAPNPVTQAHVLESQDLQAVFSLLQNKDAVLYGLLKSCQTEWEAPNRLHIKKGRNSFTFDQLKDARIQKRLVQCLAQTPYSELHLVFEDVTPSSHTSSLDKERGWVAPLEQRRQRLIGHPFVKALQEHVGAEVIKVVENQGILDSNT